MTTSDFPQLENEYCFGNEEPFLQRLRSGGSADCSGDHGDRGAVADAVCFPNEDRLHHAQRHPLRPPHLPPLLRILRHDFPKQCEIYYLFIITE